jgi:putative oxidoreductase
MLKAFHDATVTTELRMLDRMIRTGNDQAVSLIRMMVGLAVFFPEGLQKLLFPGVLGAAIGRFG